MLALQERIRPSADLRNHYNEISKQCREDKEAVIITVNGRGDTVSLGYEEYNRMKARIELLELLALLERLELLELALFVQQTERLFQFVLRNQPFLLVYQ
jgi:prevent-host-death family protein